MGSTEADNFRSRLAALRAINPPGGAIVDADVALGAHRALIEAVNDGWGVRGPETKRRIRVYEAAGRELALRWCAVQHPDTADDIGALLTHPALGEIAADSKGAGLDKVIAAIEAVEREAAATGLPLSTSLPIYNRAAPLLDSGAPDFFA